jgi:hypothetical protein
MVSMMASILVLSAELLVLIFSLWLLFRLSLGSADNPQAADGKPPAASQSPGGSGEPVGREAALPPAPVPEAAPGAVKR